MEESGELPNFSIGIDLLGPGQTSNKNKAEKSRKLDVINFALYYNKMLLRAGPCCRSVIKKICSCF